AELIKADVLIGNLETPLVRELPVKSPIGAKFAFGASKTMAQPLADAGFTALSLANNHAFDQREKGMKESPAILNELGVLPLGASRTEEPVFRLETVTHDGWKLGVVAVTTRRNAPHREGSPILPYLSTRDLAKTLVPLIQAGKQTHHAVMVVVHWGEEYADTPNYVQVREAHAMIDAGAKLVIGHHAHVLQGLERYGDGLIAYNLGNFLFENTTPIPRLTGVLRVRLAPTEEAGCVEKVVFHPAYIKRTPTKHPVPATGGMGTRVRRRMLDVSAKFDVELREEGEDLVLEGLSCGAEAKPPVDAKATSPG
ncbi:MAG: CapA family protein, partial [Nannocystaceae bacterium]